MDDRLRDFQHFEFDVTDDMWGQLEDELRVNNGVENLKALEHEVTDDIWGGIEDELRRRNRKPVIWWVSRVAASLLLLTMGGYATYTATQTDTTNTTATRNVHAPSPSEAKGTKSNASTLPEQDARNTDQSTADRTADTDVTPEPTTSHTNSQQTDRNTPFSQTKRSSSGNNSAVHGNTNDAKTTDATATSLIASVLPTEFSDHISKAGSTDVPPTLSSTQTSTVHRSQEAVSAASVQESTSDHPSAAAREPKSALIMEADTLLPEELENAFTESPPAVIPEINESEKPLYRKWRVMAGAGMGNTKVIQFQYFGADPPVSTIGAGVVSKSADLEGVNFGRAPMNELIYQIPVNVNLGAEYNVSRRVSVGLGITYTSLKSLNEVFFVQNETRLKYISTPVTVSYAFATSTFIDLRAKALIRPEKMVYSEYSILNGSGGYGENIDARVENSGINLAVGVGADIVLKVHHRTGVHISPQLTTYLKTDAQVSYRRNVITYWPEINVGFYRNF